jgi:hypothetical protein
MRYAIAFLLTAGALTVAGCGGGSSSTATETTTTVATTAPATTAPPTTAPATTAPATTAPATTAPATTTPTTTAAPQAVVIAIRVTGGKPVGGIKRGTVKKGRTVTLVVHSDGADEVHLHGYDLSKDVKVGGTVRITFKANIAGVFEVELESRKVQIAELSVR